MQKTIRILMLLAVTMLAGSGVWAQDGPSNDPSNGEGDPLGMIYYDDQDAAVTTAGGLLEFFNNDACDFDSEGNYHLSAYENVPPEWLDAERTVYIKATPNPGHKLGAADAETHAVTFITVTEGAPVMNPNGARQMSRAAGALKARTRADGDAIAVTLVRTDGQAGIYKFQMPAAVNGIASDVTVTAAFPEHTVAKLGDADYGHINYIDYVTDAQTGALTAVTRSTEDLKDANNQPVPVYVLDGTETTLGTAGTSESPTEAWYVCLTPPTDANDNKGLVYGLNGDTYGLRLANYCHVHLILADGSMMTVGGENFYYGLGGRNLTIYGQGGTDNTGQSAEGVLNVTGRIDAMDFYGDLTINGGQLNAACSDNNAIDVEGGNIAIHGGIVNASSNVSYAILAYGGDIAITGGSVISTGNSINSSDVGGSGGHLTISGGMVNFSREAIECSNSLTISGGQVEAYEIASGDDLTISGGVVKMASDGRGIYSYGCDVTISGGQVETPLIKAQKDITLGWTASSDYIKAVSFTTTSGVVKTAGKRFVALDESAGEGLPTAKAIVPANATADGGFALSDIAGQTLRPVDGYLLGLCPGLGVYRNGSAAPALEFTMAGDETTHYYIYKEDDALTLIVGGVEDGFNGMDYNDGTPVEILQEDPTAPTALPTACTEFDEDAHSMDMPARDLKIVAYRAYMKNLVKYLYVLNGKLNEKTLYNNMSGDHLKAYILDGHDHTLYGVNGGWYILLAKADKTSGWMNDGDGNWMLKDGHMFECRGDVNIILADGSALSVGTETNPFPGSGAVIYGDCSLYFFTQSEPEILQDANGNLMVYSDNRGRMEIYSSGAKAIHAERDITLTNVVLSGGKSPLEFKLYAKGDIYINGGQYDFVSFNSTKSFFFNPISSTDELHATSFSTDNDMINIADGKALADREYPTTALSGAVPATEAAGKKLTELKTISGENGRIITAGAGTADGGLFPSGVGGARGADMVAMSTTAMTGKIVQPATGSPVVTAMVTGVSDSGLFQISKVEDVVHGDCSDVIPAQVNDIPSVFLMTVDDNPELNNSVEPSSGLSPEDVSLPATFGIAGSGTDNLVQDKSLFAGQIISDNGLPTFVGGNGSSTLEQIATDAYGRQIVSVLEKIRELNEKMKELWQKPDSAKINRLQKEIDYYRNLYAQITSHTVPDNLTMEDFARMYAESSKTAAELSLGGTIILQTKVEPSYNGSSTVPKLTLTLEPVDYNPIDVPEEGETMLLITQNRLLAIANYQREHPDEVKKARARGALMIDTTTPETTAIIGRLMVTERAEPVDGHWYGLDGRRLPSAPTAKGVYVHRGRKVVIR